MNTQPLIPEGTTHMVNINSWAVYVKEVNFFKQQGGTTQLWGRHWQPVVAASIEEARRIGEGMRK